MSVGGNASRAEAVFDCFIDRSFIMLIMQDAMDMAGTAAVAWLEAALRPGPATEARLERFLRVWVAKREAEGAATFEIRTGEEDALEGKLLKPSSDLLNHTTKN